ncbi:MAG: DUF4091 domain-containing protein [Lachnospiraceae bacterium]|nr:DUF4091 domain-containing protein [Lachnospiraceae bacterium]
MAFKIKLTSSLEKVFPDQSPDSGSDSLTMLKGDCASFQLAICPLFEGLQTSVEIKINTDFPGVLRLYQVEMIPSMRPVGDTRDGYYLSAEMGLYPDLLRPLENIRTAFGSYTSRLRLRTGMWTSIWVEAMMPAETQVMAETQALVSAETQVPAKKQVPAGKYPVTFSVSAPDFNEESASAALQLEIMDAILPAQELVVTEWFHGDCVADYYHVPVFSEAHWTYMRKQISMAVSYGQNMILTPLFTPPLDTAVGGERTTIQRVDVYQKISSDGTVTWHFGFKKLERWVRMCQECGITWFEMSHLFTQWGAAACPKVMAEVEEEGRLNCPGESEGNDRKKRIFGWETDSLSDAWQEFLADFLPALTEELIRLEIEQHTVFHLSDEPSEGALPRYRELKSRLEPFLAGEPIIDALSSSPFFDEGVCRTPIIATDALSPFLTGDRPDALWVYYCCAQGYKVSNRFFGLPSARNRILGVQLYLYQVKGFLHWGYNFYNAGLSTHAITPFLNTDADGFFPSGDAFMVYPGENGEPYPSLRLAVFREALQDMRALLLLESLTDREHVTAMILEEAGCEITFSEYPHGEDFLLRLRERVNREIEERVV